MSFSEKVAVIREENGKYCVHSPKNPDWNGGCYDTKGEAEKRLEQVEYFKHEKSAALSILLAHRVASRFAKGKGLSLVPEFKKAMIAFRAGDQGPILDLCKKVIEIVLPGGGNAPPSWFNALGTAKRTTIKGLYKEAHVLLQDLPGIFSQVRFDKFPNPEEQKSRWLESYATRLEDWGKKLRTLEIATEADDEERVIQQDGFSIIPMPGVSKAETDEALEALHGAAEKIRSKFPQVLYGKVFFSTHLSAKTAAHYVYNDDTIHLSVRAKKRFDDMYTIVHEFGHRFDHKFLDAKLRARFVDLSLRKVYETIHYDAALRSKVAQEALQLAKDRMAKKPIPGFSNELELWVKDAKYGVGPYIRSLMTMYMKGEIDDTKYLTEVMGTKDVDVPTGKLLHGPLAVTPYGATKPSENFAEAFAHFVLGMAMPQEFVEILSDAK